MMSEVETSMMGRVPYLGKSDPVLHAATLTINSGSVLLFCATSLVVGLGATNRKVAWLTRAALAGVIVYAFYEQLHLDKEQIEWFRLDDARRDAYLLKHLITWRERIPEPVVCEADNEESEEEDGMETVSLKESIRQFIVSERDPLQVAYEQAWWEQLDILGDRLRQRALDRTHHYIVGLWKGGWLQSVMLLEYADGDESSLKTPAGRDNVLLLTLITAPWNLRKRQDWGKKIFEQGIKRLFPKGITVHCKPDECQPADYFKDNLKFEDHDEAGVYSRYLPHIDGIG